jgi:hypothetical protein
MPVAPSRFDRNGDLTPVEVAIDADRVYFALVLSTFDRYTDAAKRVIYFAHLEANHRDADHIGTEHILAGLSWESDSTLAEIDADIAYLVLNDLFTDTNSHFGVPGVPDWSVVMKGCNESAPSC